MKALLIIITLMITACGGEYPHHLIGDTHFIVPKQHLKATNAAIKQLLPHVPFNITASTNPKNNVWQWKIVEVQCGEKFGSNNSIMCEPLSAAMSYELSTIWVNPNPFPSNIPHEIGHAVGMYNKLGEHAEKGVMAEKASDYTKYSQEDLLILTNIY